MRIATVASRLAAFALAVGVASSVAPGIAAAHEGGELVPAPRPPAPPGDGATAERIVKEIDARAARDPRTAKLVAAPVASVKMALERAHGARVAGDVAHARMLDGLALEWAETARDLERASAAEDIARTSSKTASDVATQVERARTLLEETQARRGRAAAELEKAEADAKDAAKSAADAEQKRVEGGRKGGAARKTHAAPPVPGAKKGKS